MERNVKNASKIKLLALDVDGVLTDGSLNIGAEGELFKAFNARDGLGLSCLLRSGVRVAIITGRKSAIIHRRAEELGITELYEGIKDKRKILADLAAADCLYGRRFKRPACAFICRACLCPGRCCTGGNFCQQLCCRK